MDWDWEQWHAETMLLKMEEQRRTGDKLIYKKNSMPLLETSHKVLYKNYNVVANIINLHGRNQNWLFMNLVRKKEEHQWNIDLENHACKYGM